MLIVVDHLLAVSGSQFSGSAQIDILVVNCSLFNPTPSLSAMIVNHFKFNSNIISYNLSGMGCSAGVIAVGLAKELLQVSNVISIQTVGSSCQRTCFLAEVIQQN